MNADWIAAAAGAYFFLSTLSRYDKRRNSTNKETEAVSGQQGSQRLIQALALLGYSPAQPLHHRANLLSALRDFAVRSEDTETENACEALLNQLRSESDEPGSQT